MNREQIIRLAHQCGLMMRDQPMHGVEALAKAAYEAGAVAERKRLREEIHSCHANCDHPVCVAVRKERKECANKVGEFARKWWSIHCASNKHLETTRKAHEDFCALQSAIRARGQE
jgi:hypothetical protein